MQFTPNWNSLSIQQVQQLFANRVDSTCSVTKLEQTNRGFVNKTYIVTLSNSQQFILKVMNPTWYNNKTFNEVISMYLFKFKANIPVPTVICWECDRQKSEIGYEFIVMEKIAGTPLEVCWDTLSIKQKTCILYEIVQLLHRMRNIKLESIGNFYLSKIIVNSQHKIEDVDIVVSPLVTFQQQSEPTEPAMMVGPSSCFAQYILAYFDVHYDIMVQQADPDLGPFLQPLKKFRSVISQYGSGSEVFYLTHADLTGSNILVEVVPNGQGCTICGIIDWEWAMSAPCDVEFQRGFNFVKADPAMASHFWQMLADHNIDTKMELVHFLQGIREVGSHTDRRHHIFAVERLVSKLVYLPVYYPDPTQQKQLKQEYLHLMGSILEMYDCVADK